MLTTIEQFRDRLSAISNRASRHLVAPTPEGIAELDRCRSEMARILSIYNLFVHREIFEPLLLAGSPIEAAAAKEMKVECICLVEEFRRFSGEWRLANVAAAWAEFQPTALNFRMRIQRHLDRVMAIADPALSSRRLAEAA